MTEVGERAMTAFLKKQEKGKCAFKPEGDTWEANLAGSSTALEGYLGNKPDASNESELSSKRWPSQAHHLIPHLTLKDHGVALWLKKKGSSVMWGDTFYNVDHANNGVWLPYASALAGWKRLSAKRKRELRFKVMKLSGLQHHEGAHSGKNRYGIGEQPYKVCVIGYLDRIKQNAVSHYKKQPPCDDCKSNSKAGKVPPRANTVRFVDKASKLTWDDIREERIFVSRIAAEFAETVGFD